MDTTINDFLIISNRKLKVDFPCAFNMLILMVNMGVNKFANNSN